MVRRTSGMIWLIQYFAQLFLHKIFPQFEVQGSLSWTKRLALGCVNRTPVMRGGGQMLDSRNLGQAFLVNPVKGTLAAFAGSHSLLSMQYLIRRQPKSRKNPPSSFSGTGRRRERGRLPRTSSCRPPNISAPPSRAFPGGGFGNNASLFLFNAMLVAGVLTDSVRFVF